jgi:hypothetical protein
VGYETDEEYVRLATQRIGLQATDEHERNISATARMINHPSDQVKTR